jgi:membrane protein YqaA with SNARE-associated domain
VSWFALFVYSALAATLLPGGSEILLVGMLIEQPEHGIWLWLIASIGNSLGAWVTFYMGGLLALGLGRTQFKAKHKIRSRLKAMFTLPVQRVEELQRYGVWILLFSWVPVIGDGFCVAAGYLGWSRTLCLSLIVIGKATRYGVVWMFLVWV